MHSPSLSLSLPRARREISRLRAAPSAALTLLHAVRRDALSAALAPPRDAADPQPRPEAPAASALEDYVNPALFPPLTVFLVLTLPLLYPLSHIPPQTLLALALLYPLYYALVFCYMLTEIASRPPWYTPALPTANCPPYWSTAIHDPRVSLALPFVPVSFSTATHTLRGWHIPSPTHPRSTRHIVCVHGAGRDRRAFLRHAAHLATIGHVTLFDTSEHGESSTTASGGRGTSFGAREQHDVAAAVAFVRDRFGAGAVALVGTSTGASAAILASANGLVFPPPACIVAENPFARADDLLVHHLNSATENYLADESISGRRCRSAFFWLASRVLLMRMGVWAGPADVAEKVQCSLMVAHSRVDAVVPFAQGWEVYERARSAGVDARFFAVEDAVHCALFDKCPDEWVAEVGGFLEEGFTKADGDRFVRYGPERYAQVDGEEWED